MAKFSERDWLSGTLQPDGGFAPTVVGTFDAPVGGATEAAQDTANGYLLEMRNSLGDLATDTSPVNVVPPGGTTPSANFTRPANTTAYASGDLVANHTTAGSVVPLSWVVAREAAGSGSIRRARISKTGTSTTNAVFYVHLYRSSPTVTNGDNGVWLSSQAATYLGAFSVTVDKVFSDGSAGTGAPLVGSEINFKLPSTDTIYGLIEARGAYTPTSAEVFTVELEVLQN